MHHGWDLATYQQPAHPAQEAALQMFAACVGLDARQIATGVDGCGIVCYATPVTVAAATFALMPELLPEISAAMRAHPVLVEGPDLVRHDHHGDHAGRDQQERRRGARLRVAARRSRLLGQGRRRRRPGDGAGRRSPCCDAVLGADALPERPAALGRPPIKNDAGDVVGELLAVVPE